MNHFYTIGYRRSGQPNFHLLTSSGACIKYTCRNAPGARAISRREAAALLRSARRNHRVDPYGYTFRRGR